MSLSRTTWSRVVAGLTLGLVLVGGCPPQDPAGRPDATDSSCDPVAASSDCAQDEACHFDLDDLAATCQADSPSPGWG